MKLRGFRCDRCGEEYDKNRLKNPEDKTGFNVIGFAFVNTAKQIQRYDLCDPCIAELQAWVNNPEMYVAGPEELLVDTVGEPDMGENEEEE